MSFGRAHESCGTGLERFVGPPPPRLLPLSLSYFSVVSFSGFLPTVAHGRWESFCTGFNRPSGVFEMGGAASPSIVPRCTLWKVRCKLFLVKPARPALSTAVPRYLLVQAVSLLGNKLFENLAKFYKILQTFCKSLQGSFSAVSTPIFASKYSLESSRRHPFAPLKF